MTIEYKDKPTAHINTSLHDGGWLVCYDIDGKYYDDGETRTGTSALFRDPNLAEDFIKNCVPEENRDKFYIVHITD